MNRSAPHSQTDDPQAAAAATVTPAPAQAADDTTPSFITSENLRSDTSVVRNQARPAPEPMVTSSAVEAPLPFARLGHYEIVRKIGRGGMGDVYLGYEQALDRQVAIKVLPADLARSEDFVRRFQAEATAAAKLIHPHIIQIFFIGAEQGHHYFAMQYVEGESLADLLKRRGKLEVDETLAIVEQALLGLSAAHEQGMVHRDIKPGNILLDTRHRRAMLADFGLVKMLEGSPSGQTATGVVMGTVDYISPEQGRGAVVDARSDLYSVGVLMFQMLSGRLPFTADSPTALIFQHVYELPPDLRKTAPDVPEALARVVARLLAKSPADRHQTAAEILSDLRACRLGHSIPAHSAGARDRKTAIIRLPEIDEPAALLPADLLPAAPTEPPSQHWWDRTKDRALSLFRRHAPQVLEQLQNTQQQMEGAIAVHERRRRDLQQLAQEAEAVLAELAELERQAQAERAAAATAAERGARESDPQQVESALREQAECASAAAELEQRAADQREQLELIQLRLAQAQATLTQLSNQRDLLQARLVTAHVGNGGARLHRTRVNVALPILVAGIAALIGLALMMVQPEQISIEIPASPDISQAAFENAVPWKTLLGHKASVWCVAVTADGTRAISGSGEAGTQTDNSLRVWDLKTGRELAKFSGHRNRVLSVSVSPNADRVLSGSQDSAIFLWDAKSGQEVASFGANAGQIVKFAPGGQFALFAGQGTLAWRDVGQPTEKRDFSLGDQLVWNVAIDKNARRTATCGGQVNTFQIWDIASGKAIRRVAGHTGWIENVSFTPDGLQVLSASHDATLRLWMTDNGAAVRTFQGHKGPVLAAAVSPDGQFILSGGADRTVRLWNLATGEELARGTGHQGQIRAVAFALNGHIAVSGGTDGSVRLWKFKALRSISK